MAISAKQPVFRVGSDTNPYYITMQPITSGYATSQFVSTSLYYNPATQTLTLSGGASSLNVSGTAIVVTGESRFSANITAAGYMLPSANATYDLGSSTLRWRNIYTNDLQLSNGIGDYTVVEGEDDLFLYNNRTGKTYKFLLQEVDPSTVPPKAKQD
jgi:hypothetical protein